MWELDHREGWMLKNLCFWTVVLENTLGSLVGSKKIQPVNPNGNQPWIFTGKNDAEDEALILGHLMGRADSVERSWGWESLKAGGEGNDRWWDGWMASLTQWTWVWANSRREWRTERPGVLHSMGSQRVEHDWVTEQQVAYILSP